jgi:very-short-patch-repair endonuclease
MAAVLACGEGALLGHHPGAVVLGFRPPPAGPPHVVVPTDVRSRPGLRVHRVSNLHPADATRVQGIPVTSPARTLLDLAAELPQRETDRATDEARVRHLVTEHSLNKQFSRYPRHPGIAALKRAQQTDPKLTRSEAERRLLELIRAARLPEPETNIRLHGHEVDFLWRECGLVVEVDGYAFHSGRGSFERDRRRDAQLATAGYTVIRFTWRQITDEPAVVVATLAATLAAQRPPLRLRSSTVSA